MKYMLIARNYLQKRPEYYTGRRYDIVKAAARLRAHDNLKIQQRQQNLRARQLCMDKMNRVKHIKMWIIQMWMIPRIQKMWIAKTLYKINVQNQLWIVAEVIQC